MNLSAYSLEQLQQARRVLDRIGVTPAVLGNLDENLRDEIKCRSAETKHVMVSLIQGYLTALNECAPTPAMDEARLDQAWRALRTAVEALRAPTIRRLQQ